ncbi:helix-turn-helix transcriptional regulator [Micromonospora sp. WMMA1363]|uniref:helix-turn-helix domain-containing protein n=1 Tax=Micromonospora sp. WMMA1363 TaxID=3053985 RepID=UPI00259C6AB4|nr:helix-turn-helix transcriptional regulator [Micromonospora sp. WMMA1363]MDM4721974.1 helix-turn-helix transcriptional regulator [Micromonospora sp. WMMA1363]
MARRERPIDPTVSPVARFAQELRQLRAEAGAPTYRAMAKQAGFSATTLSEAAAGRRQPSLDVVLAYVGVCGGDPDQWRAQWERMAAAAQPPDPVTTPDPTPAATVAPMQGAPAPGGAPATSPRPTKSDTPAETATSAERTRRWGRTTLLVAAAVAVAAVVAGVAAQAVSRPTQSTPTGEATAAAARSTCPPVSPSASFTGTTYAGLTRIRSGASLDSPELATVPANCELTFTGFCIGDTVTDQTSGTPDVRWFTVAGGGVVASAVVHGNPPPSLRPSPCLRERPVPSSVRLTATTRGTGLRLRATGVHLDIVGFAARYPTDPDLPNRLEWSQIALTESAGGAFEASWQPDQLPKPLDSEIPVMFAAVACLGGGGPTDILDVGQAINGDFRTSSATELDTPTRANALRSACRYPNP